MSSSTNWDGPFALESYRQPAWRLLGATRIQQLLALVEPVGSRLLARIDGTAGPEWMSAARERRATA
jgi:hypothetical protein